MMFRTTAITLALFAIVACAKEKQESATPANVPANAPAAGKTIVIEVHTDSAGNYFKPNQVTAHAGDVLRITLVTGVHNVHFLPDSNPGKKGLPPATDFLQLPGQTVDIPVTFEAGTYYFQCDPHALLGMHGHLVVQ
jgi:plastocyanin